MTDHQKPRFINKQTVTVMSRRFARTADGRPGFVDEWVTQGRIVLTKRVSACGSWFYVRFSDGTMKDYPEEQLRAA